MTPVTIRPARRLRFIALAGLAVTGAVALMGSTFASFADAEWADAGDGYAINPASYFNLQIADGAGSPDPESVDDVTWRDTSADGSSPDGAFEPTQITDMAPYLPSSSALYPGWTATTDLYLRNDSTFSSLVALSATDLQSQAIGLELQVEIGVAVPEIEEGLVGAWQPLADYVTTVAALAATPIDLTSGLAVGPGEWFRVSVTLTFDADASLNVRGHVTDTLLAQMATQHGGFKFRFAATQITSGLDDSAQVRLYNEAMSALATLDELDGGDWYTTALTAWTKAFGDLTDPMAGYPGLAGWAAFNSSAVAFHSRLASLAESAVANWPSDEIVDVIRDFANAVYYYLAETGLDPYGQARVTFYEASLTALDGLGVMAQKSWYTAFEGSHWLDYGYIPPVALWDGFDVNAVSVYTADNAGWAERGAPGTTWAAAWMAYITARGLQAPR